MSLHLDASVLVGLLAPDALSARADALLRSRPFALLVSDFAAAEFASALGRRVRIGDLTAERARAASAGFDAWMDGEEGAMCHDDNGGRARGRGVSAPP